MSVLVVGLGYITIDTSDCISGREIGDGVNVNSRSRIISSANCSEACFGLVSLVCVNVGNVRVVSVGWNIVRRVVRIAKGGC